MKNLTQLTTELHGDTALSRDDFFEVVRATAPSVGGVTVIDTTQRGVRLGVKRGPRTVASFEAVTLKPKEGQDATRTHVDVSWDEPTIKNLLAKSGDSTVRIAKGAMFGMPGFKPYRSYLDALIAAVGSQDATANLRVVVKD